MKKYFYLFLFISAGLAAQNNTEVYLFDVKKTDSGYQLINKRNISNNKGYDSQPYFYDENTIIYASNRNGETDIASYNIKTDKSFFILTNTGGGEYSPQRIPNSENISAIRLDNHGLQRFYKFDIKVGGDSYEEIISDLKVAYPFWIDEKTVISSVIGKDNLELVISDLETKTNKVLQKNVGRSFHKIPNSNSVSFISKNNKNWEIKAFNIDDSKIYNISKTDENFEDIAWLPNGSILQAKNNLIVSKNPKKDNDWSVFANLESQNITNISRIAVSKDGKQIALVGQPAAALLAEKQLQAYNKRDIDAFLEVFDKNVKVYDFPNKLQYTGTVEMRKRYESFFRSTEDLNCKLLNRIEKDNVVIDHELVTANGRKFKAVAIYKIEHNKIVSVTFM